MKKEEGAFTLVELVITLSLVAVLSIVVTPLFNNAMQQMKLNACAEQVAAHLRYSRRLAMEEQAGKIFFAHVSQNYYEVIKADFTYEKNPLDETKDFSFSLDTDPSCKGINIDMVSFPQGATSSNILTWDGDGKPHVGLYVTDPLMTNPGVIRLRNAVGRFLSVFIAHETGSVIVGKPS